MEFRDWISLGGLLAAVTAFASGLYQYARAQKWKRAEFVANQVKEFEADRHVALARLMLDYNMRTLELFPEEEDRAARSAVVWDDKVRNALVPHSRKPGGYTPEEIAIRDAFDHFFDGLQRFEHFIQAGLVNADEFRPYLLYWIEIIADPKIGRKSEDFVRTIWDYIEFYDYADVQSLCRRYGYDIRPATARGGDPAGRGSRSAGQA